MRPIVAAIVLVGLAACGGSDDDAAAIDTATTESTAAETTTTSTVATTETTPPTTAAPTTTSPPSTTTTPTTAPPTVPPTAPPSGALTAECLQGSWLLGDAATAELHSALLPGFPVTVEGSHQLTFDGADVEYYVNEVLRFTPAGADIAIPFDQRSAGTFAITGEEITMAYDEVEGGFVRADGTVTNSQDELTDVAPHFIPPDFALPTVGGGPATCEGDTFTIIVTSGLGTAPAIFTRL